MQFSQKLLLLCRTVRHLRFRQVAFQFWYRLKPKPRISNGSSISIRENKSVWNGCKYARQTYFPPDSFDFLNHKVTASSGIEWNDEKQAKLWLYNLHYFDDLNAVGSELRVDAHKKLVLRWINENPVMKGNGWEPYPLSLRIVNWVKWLKCFPHQADDSILSSLHAQVEALEKQLEFHILANHLFANLKALIFAGCYFEDADGERWLHRGLKLLEQELAEQFLADGAHYERSPMYHCILLWDVLDLIYLLRSYELGSTAELEKTASRGLGWLSAIQHPDGEIPFFNDSTFGIAPTIQAINDYSAHLDVGEILCELNESGFATSTLNDIYLVADIGEIGPAYQPGHAHAEAGAFELSVFGKRVFVNSGINEYGISSERLFQRSSAAHNTLTAIVNGKELNSSEIWSGFRVARRAQVKIARERSRITCEIKGFFNGLRTATHKRAFIKREQKDGFIITDEIFRMDEGLAHFYLHPDCIAKLEEKQVIISIAGKSVRVEFTGTKVGVSLVPSKWFCEFGKAMPNQCVLVQFKDKLETSVLI